MSETAITFEQALQLLTEAFERGDSPGYVGWETRPMGHAEEWPAGDPEPYRWHEFGDFFVLNQYEPNRKMSERHLLLRLKTVEVPTKGEEAK